MPKWKTLAVAFGFVVLGILLAPLAIPQIASVTPPPAGLSEPAAVKRIAGLGIVEPETGEIDLAAQMPGVIAAIAVQEGENVRQGQVIAEIVNNDLKAKVAQAEAAVKIRTAQLDRVKSGARQQEVRQAESVLSEQAETLKLLRLQFDRQKLLAKKGVTANDRLDQAETALATAMARKDSAEQSLSLVKAGARQEEVTAAAAEVELAGFQLEEARAALEKSYIRASTDGVILRLYKEAGEAVSTQPATPVAQLGDLSRLVARVQIDEADIARLHVGQRAEIAAPAFPGQTVGGSIIRLSPRLGTKTIVSGAATEKRDARVLDVIVRLDPGVSLPVSLRVDAYIQVEDEHRAEGTGTVKGLPQWSFRR